MNASAIFSSCSSLSSLRFPSGIYQVTFTSPSFSALVLKDGPIWVLDPMCHYFPPSFKKECTKMQWELPSCRCLVTSDGDSEAIDSQILQLLTPGVLGLMSRTESHRGTRACADRLLGNAEAGGKASALAS